MHFSELRQTSQQSLRTVVVVDHPFVPKPGPRTLGTEISQVGGMAGASVGALDTVPLVNTLSVTQRLNTD